jgi:predicted DNA-binding WGR domain protein
LIESEICRGGVVRRWEFVSAGSAKFWECAADGLTVTVHYGRIGTAGQTQTKEFGTAAEAASYLAKAVVEKEKKGYKEVDGEDGGGAPGPQAVQAAQAADVAPAASIPAAEPEPAALPDEDTLVVPASWRRIIHPRRGDMPGPAVKLQPGTWEQDGTVFVHDDARTPVPRDVVKAEPGRYCGATPEEAGKLAQRVMPRHDQKLWGFVDTWVQERGIVFAAAATVSLGSDGSYGGSKTRREAFLRMRRILTAASEADYAEAVRALAELRGDFTSRVIVSYLVPTEMQWADEVCAEYHSASHHQFDQMLLSCVVSTPGQLAAVGPGNLLNNYYTGLAEMDTLAAALGAAAVPVFAALVNNGGYMSTDTRRGVLATLAHLPGDEAFELLANRLDEKHVSGATLEAMGRFPVRALRLLAKTANGGTKSAPIARTLLAGHVRSHAGLVEAVLPGDLPEPDASLIATVAQESGGRPEASADALPPLLVAPPWTVRRAKRAAPTVLAGLIPPRISRIDWLPGERGTWEASNPYRPRDSEWEKRAEQYATEGFGRRVWEAREFFAGAPEHLARPLLPSWKPDFSYWNMVDALGVVLTRFELDAFPLVIAAALEVNPGSGGVILQPIVDLTVARLMADWFTRLKSGRAHAVSWLTRHAESAAPLLIPDAVGKPGNQRLAAENALRLLAPLTDVRAAAETYGADVVEAVGAVLEADPLELLPLRMPTLPAWLEGAQLPQILLRGRAYALPADSVRHVLSMLAISKPGEPYAGLAVVRECADPTSLAEFAWALLGVWQAMDMPPKEAWVLTALGWFGDDDTVRRLAPLIRAWPGEGGHHRAVAGLDVLAELGTDIALMQLHQISQKVKFKALKSRAQEKIAEIARSLDLTADQLSDRLVPDFGLDAEGGLWLDYGPRRFRVGFDEQLKPVVADEEGVRRKDLPPPNAKDDKELAAASRKHFSGLKKDVRNVAAEVIRRLESAMATGRTWTAVEFRELLLEHPLVWHITRRLVWLEGAQNGPRRSFRVAEDRTLATVDDEEFQLPEEARIALAHPLQLGEELAAWAEVFADYEILQPFAQLGRPVYALTEQERAERNLARFEGAVVPVGRLLGMSHRGWERSSPMDAGIQGSVSRQVDENLYLVIDLNPGIAIGYVNDLGDQTLSSVYLATHPDGHWGRPGEDAPRLGGLDPVIASELLGDLTHLVN